MLDGVLVSILCCVEMRVNDSLLHRGKMLMPAGRLYRFLDFLKGQTLVESLSAQQSQCGLNACVGSLILGLLHEPDCLIVPKHSPAANDSQSRHKQDYVE